MKLFLIGLALLATVYAQAPSVEYLPPAEEPSASHVVETNFLESEPAHSLADDGYRYKTVKRFRLRHRRDVNELSNEYLPPHAASAPAPVYSAPAPVAAYSAPAPVYSAPVAAESAPAVSYGSAPAAVEQTYEVAASEPAAAHTLSDDGYRYRAVKRYRLRRRRRDVSELSNEYLPPHAASAPAPVYSAPAPVAAYSAPAPVYSAPVAAESAPAVSFASAPAAVEQTYEVAASEPAAAHTLSDDGYRYRAVKRYRLRRRRRDVSELSNEYLPPHAASAPAPVYSAPAPVAAYSAPAPVYSAPVAVESAPAVSFASAPAAVEQTYEVAASEPAAAHTLSDDGYRYRAVKRYRLRRRRRDVSELFNEYLPPHAASAPAPVYSAPAPVAAYSAPAPVYSTPVSAESAPAVSFASAPAAVEQTYEVAASEPAAAHTLSDDGYRYRAVKRYRLRRRRRDVSEISNEYLPPHAASAPAPVYSAPAPVAAYSAPAPVYSAPVAAESAPAVSFASAPAAVEQTYEVAASEPAAAHTLSDDGYRYRAVKRYRLRRRRRNVNELSNEYLPPHAASAPAPVYSAPAPVAAYSAPAPVYSAPVPAESAPAVSFASAPAAVEQTYEVAASEPAAAHTLSDDGYRYRAVKRYRLRRRRRDVSELSNEYLPPHAASAPAPVYSAPAPVAAYSAPAPVYSAPVAAESAPAVSFASAPAAVEQTYEVAASEPAAAHTLSDDGYRYRAVKRYRLRRRRRDVSEISNEYLPPHAASAPAPVYSAPAPVAAYSAPAPVYAAPAPAESAPAVSFAAAPAAVEQTYEVAASEPAAAHTLSNDGYRYKTVKRYRYRHRH